MKRIGWVAAGILALLAGCKPEKGHGGADPASVARAMTSAEAAIRTDLPAAKNAQFRGVQSYDQALPGRRAVCGQVSPYGDDEILFVPFVAVMTRSADGAWTSTQDSRFVGTSVSEADRTYLAIVAHCYDKGGPSDGPVQSVAPLPPMPNQIPRPATPSAPTTAPTAATADGVAIPAGGTVTLRQNANLHATPHGASVRVVPQGTALHVFATAAGGWYQVGDEAPWGWVHESMLDGLAR